jgi:hypothetical protein
MSPTAEVYVCRGCGFVTDRIDAEGTFERGGQRLCSGCGAKFDRRLVDESERKVLEKRHSRTWLAILAAEPIVWIVVLVLAALGGWLAK